MILSKYNRLKIRWFYSTIPWEFLNRITSSPWPATNCLCKVRLVDQQWFYVKIPREFCHRIKTVRGDSISTFPGNVEIESKKKFKLFFEVCQEIPRNFPDRMASIYLESVRKFPGKFRIDSLLVSENHIHCNFEERVRGWPRTSSHSIRKFPGNFLTDWREIKASLSGFFVPIEQWTSNIFIFMVRVLPYIPPSL